MRNTHLAEEASSLNTPVEDINDMDDCLAVEVRTTERYFDGRRVYASPLEESYV